MTDVKGPRSCQCVHTPPAFRAIAWPTFGARRLYQCRHCGLAQLYPLPVAENKIDEFYQNADYMEDISPEEYEGYFTFFLEHLTTRLGLTPDQHVLDFGAGKCYYHLFFSKTGFKDVHSLEINRNFVAFARDKLGLDNVHTNSAVLEPESFDLVLSNQVFEHLVDPVRMLNETILPLVKPGGRVVFAVPNWFSWNRNILGRLWLGYSPDDHIWFFSKKSAEAIFHPMSGIEIEDITVESSIGKPYSKFRPAGFVKQAYLQLVWTQIERLGHGDQLIVSLRKNGG